ncbi:MAG: 2-dehydropantoate 2-reductase [Eubacteriaceae bacterium]
MKYLIVGSGGIGGSLGAFLSRAGKDVTFIARGEHLKQIKQNGLKVSSDIFGEFIVSNASAVTEEEYCGKADVIFVCVKGYALKGIKDLLIKASLPSTVIIPILNGLNIGEKIEKMIGEDKTVLDGCLYLHGYIGNPGEIKQIGTSNKILFGTRKDRTADMNILEQIKNDLTVAGMNAVISYNIACDIYKKFACNASFGVCGAYYGIKTGDMQYDGIYRSTAIELLKELNALAAAQGVEFDEDLAEASLRFIDNFSPDAKSSFQRDIEAGKQSEIDTLLFDVVRSLREFNVNAPCFEKIASHFGFKE